MKSGQEYPITKDDAGNLCIVVNKPGSAFLIEPALNTTATFPIRVRPDDALFRERELLASRAEPDEPFQALKFYFPSTANVGDMWNITIADKSDLLPGPSCPVLDEAGRMVMVSPRGSILVQLREAAQFNASATFYLNNDGSRGAASATPGAGFDVASGDSVELVATGSTAPQNIVAVSAFLEILDRGPLDPGGGSPRVLDRIMLTDANGSQLWDGTTWRNGYAYCGTGSAVGVTSDTGTKVFYGRRVRAVRPGLIVTLLDTLMAIKPAALVGRAPVDGGGGGGTLGPGTLPGFFFALYKF